MVRVPPAADADGVRYRPVRRHCTPPCRGGYAAAASPENSRQSAGTRRPVRGPRRASLRGIQRMKINYSIISENPARTYGDAECILHNDHISLLNFFTAFKGDACACCTNATDALEAPARQLELVTPKVVFIGSTSIRRARSGRSNWRPGSWTSLTAGATPGMPCCRGCGASRPRTAVSST